MKKYFLQRVIGGDWVTIEAFDSYEDVFGLRIGNKERMIYQDGTAEPIVCNKGYKGEGVSVISVRHLTHNEILSSAENYIDPNVTDMQVSEEYMDLSVLNKPNAETQAAMLEDLNNEEQNDKQR
jgi:hypothetical protein